MATTFNKVFYSFLFVTAITFAVGSCTVHARAQEQQQRKTIVLEPLFEYPVAPDDMPDITSRSNYIVENFWKPFDFKQNSVGQIQLNDAMQVFVTPMRWADKKVVDKAVNELLKNLQKNPTLTYQFTKAAENALYSDRADIWIDEVYLKFVNAMLANKKISDVRKAKYKMQQTTLSSSLIGNKIGEIDFTDINGNSQKVEYTTPLTLVEFGSPDCADCRYVKLKLDTNSEVSKMLESGKLAIYFIVPDAESEEMWQVNLAEYPSSWKTGAGKELDEKFDIRSIPSIYLLDSKGVIVMKNRNIEDFIEYAKNFAD